MKWVLVAIGIWSDGSYSFVATQSFDTKAECKAPPSPETYVMNGQATLHRSYVCVPEGTWNAFVMKGIK